MRKNPKKKTTISRKRAPAKPVDRATLYAQRVVAGLVVAGPHVRNAARRHLDDLQRTDIVWDTDEVARKIGFFETRLKLSEGQFEGQPLVLHESQAFIVGSIFGWKRPDGRRRFRRAYVEEGKGNGKSPLAGGIGVIGLAADNEPGAEIYAAGATKDQAGILFRDAVKMCRKSPAIDGRVAYSGSMGKEFNIAYHKNGSFFRPVSRETKRTGSGPRPHMALIDELHEHPDAGIIEMLERGFKFRRNPLLFMITNSGTDRNSACWTEHEHAVRVAAGNREAKDDDAFYVGEIIDDTTFAFVCSLDPGDDPLTDPTCWAKANPLLGVTITEEYLAGVVEQARNLPAKLNGILRLHFCVWTDAATAWMTRAELDPCLAEFDPQDHLGKNVWIGTDLSQNRDITAAAAVVQTGFVESGTHAGKPTYDAWVTAWTPGDTVDARELRDKIPYRVWVEKGHLLAPPGTSINYRHVAQWLAEMDHDYRIVCNAYDRYAFKRGLEPACQELGLTIEFVEHPQGGVKKGKPTESMVIYAKEAGREPEGLWMPASVKQLEALISEQRIRIHANPVMISALLSATTDTDRWGNYWLAKERSVQKIDCAVALAMAVGAAHACEVAEHYATGDMMVL